MVEIMEAIEKNLRSHHGVKRAPIVDIIRKSIVVQTDGHYPQYVTQDNK